MTTYSNHEIEQTIKAELKRLRGKCPGRKVRLDNPRWYLHVDGQNTCLSIRYIATDGVIETRNSHNVAI